MIARVRKSMEEKDQGFTLIELLVVMIIIGVLAAIAVPVFLNQRAKARLTSAKSDASVISKEMASYYVDGSAVLALTGSANAWTLTSGSTTISSGKLSGVNTAAGSGTTDGKYCVTVSTGTPGDGNVTITAQGLTVNSPAVTTACTPA